MKAIPSRVLVGPDASIPSHSCSISYCQGPRPDKARDASRIGLARD
jgi:hypothetical protein